MGESALCFLFIAVVALIVLGIFVALMVLFLALQRSSQRYLKVLYLKDIAERFTVVDRAGLSAGIAEAPQFQSMTTGATLASPDVSQEPIRRMLQEELWNTRGVIRNTARGGNL